MTKALPILFVAIIFLISGCTAPIEKTELAGSVPEPNRQAQNNTKLQKPDTSIQDFISELNNVNNSITKLRKPFEKNG